MKKNAYSQGDGGTQFIDDGGPNSYSTHYQNLVDDVGRSFMTAKQKYEQKPKRVEKKAGLERQNSGIVRCSGRIFQSCDTTARMSLLQKSATIVGGPNTSELEQAFERIAETYITDKAPLLTNYMLGFQLLKKTNDDTKACGIFAYKVGDELVYIPVFSINGDIQGHELMYVVSRDQFVPSDEKWVNFLLSRKPIEPGRIESRDRSEIPVHGNVRPTYMSSGLKLSSWPHIPKLAPEFTLDAIRTLFKQASVGTPALERSFWRDVATCRGSGIPMVFWKKASAVDMDVTQLFRESRQATKLAAFWSRKYPVFGRLLKYAMGEDDLTDYLRDWQQRADLAKKLGVTAGPQPTLRDKLASMIGAKTPVAVKEGSVRVLGVEDIPRHQFRFMSLEQIDQIQRDGYSVRDTRDPAKLASIIRDENDRGLCNPVGPGLYQVFMADGSFRECFVLYRDNPMRHGDRESRWIVLDKKTKKSKTVALGEIWTTARDSDPKWMEKLPPSNGQVNLKGEYEYERHKEITSYLITPSGHAWEGRFLQESENAYYDEDSNIPVSLTSTTIKGFKSICSRSGNDGYSSHNSPVIASRNTVLRRYRNEQGCDDRLALGSRPLWLAMLMEGTLPVTVQKQQRAFAEYAIDGEQAQEKKAALESLMVRYHLSQETADEMLKQADTAYPRCARFRCEKIAFSGKVPDDKFSVTFPSKERGSHEVTGLGVEQDLDTEESIEALRPTREPDDREMWPGLLDAETNSSSGPPSPNQEDIQLAAQAARNGQKDFVSSQMLLSLLREIDNNDLIPKYINTFEKACDTLGRLYMQLLWRTDAFEERFGQTQLNEFKEMLVSLFQEMGDFICYLRQRDIRPAPVLSMSATNIEEKQ